MSVRKLFSRAALMAGLAAATLGVAAPAGASEGDGVIQDGEFIAWEFCSPTGSPMFDFASSAVDYRNYFFVNGVNTPDNRVSFVANFSAVNSVNAFFNPFFSGPRLVVLPRTSMGLCGGPFNDQLSSHTF